MYFSLWESFYVSSLTVDFSLMGCPHRGPKWEKAQHILLSFLFENLLCFISDSWFLPHELPTVRAKMWKVFAIVGAERDTAAQPGPGGEKNGIVKWYVVVIVSDWRCWFTFGVGDDGLVMVAKVNLTTVPDSKYRKDYNVGGVAPG